MACSTNGQDTAFTRGCKDSTINTAREITVKLRRMEKEEKIANGY
jgi:hypothetical protein